MGECHKRIAIVLFAGTGERFGLPYPKQFVDLGGRTLLEETVGRIAALKCVDSLLLVSRAEDIDRIEEILNPRNPKILGIVPGGASRQQSAYLGLLALKEMGIDSEDLVAICDGDRPNISQRVFIENFAAAASKGAAVTAIKSSDSLLRSKDGKEVDSYLAREEVYLVQTPQTFRFGLILKAHEEGKDIMATDDASLVIRTGGKVAIVNGEKNNVKITVKEDLQSWK